MSSQESFETNFPGLSAPRELQASIMETTPFCLDAALQPNAPPVLVLKNPDDVPGLRSGLVRMDREFDLASIAQGRLAFAVDANHETEGEFSALIRVLQTSVGTAVTIGEMEESGAVNPLSRERQELVGKILTAAGYQYGQYRRTLPPEERASRDAQLRPVVEAWARSGRRAA